MTAPLDPPPDSPSSPLGAAGAPLPYRQKRSAADIVAAHAAAAGAPYSAMVEIADRCNEACVHCYQVQGEKGELDTAQWERIFRELAELGVLFLTISGGEATLRKDFLHLVAYARRLRFAVKIFSNGLKISDELAAELARLSVQEVQISLYSHQPELHDRVTRVPGSFLRVVAAVRALRSAGVKVVLKSPLMSLNASRYAEYVEFVTRLGADYMLDPKLNPREDGSLEPTALSIDKRTYLRVRSDPRFARAPRRLAARPLDASPCGACQSNVHVEANGELRPCTQWNVPTGHALETSLRDAWYDNAAARAIRSITWNDLPGCRECDLRAFCQRCFADSQRYTGDAFAPYGLACRTALWKYEAHHGVEPDIVCDADPKAAEPSADAADPGEPLGPFRRLEPHRFSAAASWVPSQPANSPHSPPSPSDGATLGSALGPSPVARGTPTLVPLRRHASGPALTGGASAPVRS